MTPAGVHGTKSKLPTMILPDIDRMERIHVLLRVNGVDDRLLGNMLRHRHLAQDARNYRALVQLCDQTEQFLLRGLLGKRTSRCKIRTARRRFLIAGRKSRSPDRCRR